MALYISPRPNCSFSYCPLRLCRILKNRLSGKHELKFPLRRGTFAAAFPAKNRAFWSMFPDFLLTPLFIAMNRNLSGE
jgi:hypothetical protein